MRTPSGSAVPITVLVALGWTLVAGAGCSAPEPIRLLRGTGGRPSDSGVSSGGTTGSGGNGGTGGGFIFGSGGSVFASGGALGSGGLPASGGAPGSGGVPSSGGVPATGGAGTGGIIGTGGTHSGTGGMAATGGRGTGGATTTGGVAGRAATGGASAGGAAGGARGTGGGGGANCITAIQAANYSVGSLRCADCKENTVSRESTCIALVDCLGASWPCTGNCATDCRNKVVANSVVQGCVDALTAAAMCN